MKSRRSNLPLGIRLFRWFGNVMIAIGIAFIFEAYAAFISKAAEANVIYITTETEAAEENKEVVAAVEPVLLQAFTNINIRSTPSFDGEVIGNIPQGDEIDNIISVEGAWTLIQENGLTGYVNNAYLGTKETYDEYLKKQDEIETQVLKCSSYLTQMYGFGEDLQKFLYDQTKSVYSDTVDRLDYYYYLLAVIQRESEFKIRAYHKNSNGSTDLGLMQINSCMWKELKQKGIISSSEDLYDPYTNIVAGLYELNQCVAKYGLSENAYYMYNTGRRNKPGTNKNSHIVWDYFLEWKNRFETN